jgi:hypothetical protein
MGETVNKIFAKHNVLNTAKNVQKVQYNREYMLSSTAASFNTYLNMGVFPTFSDTYEPEYEEETKDGKKTYKEKSVGIGTSGVRSLFNRAGSVILGPGTYGTKFDPSKGDVNNTTTWRISNNVPLMDSPKARQRIREDSGCSISDLVQASESGRLGRATYSYSDFMFCKHLGKMPNNYLITLRRFPLPVDDYITAQGELSDHWDKTGSKNASCIGCMVTWIGISGNTMEGILKYSYKQPFKEQNSEEQKANNADQNQTPLNGIFSIFDESYRSAYMEGRAGEAANGVFSAIGINAEKFNPPYNGEEYWAFRDQNKVYGPIDSIRSTYVRADTGLTFDHKISLVFEYELRSYNGVNGRQAMLDLISNILNVTYTTGTFWGGGYKASGAHQSNIFNNLEMFKCKGGFTDFIEAFSKDLSTVGEKAAGGLGGSPKEIIKNVFKQVNSIGGMLIGGMLNRLGRPQKQMFHSLLSPAPIGFWHVMIGNPKHPIMSIGNMIITNVSIEHNGPLGIDDFPTGLKVTVELDRGKPRDLRDIEKLYMQGNDRIFHSMGPKVFDMYYNAEEYKSNGINYTPKSNIVTVDNTQPDPITPTISGDKLTKLKSNMKKYFGTEDLWSVYIPAAEQEFGAGKKKPSTEANKNVTGANNGK